MIQRTPCLSWHPPTWCISGSPIGQWGSILQGYTREADSWWRMQWVMCDPWTGWRSAVYPQILVQRKMWGRRKQSRRRRTAPPASILSCSPSVCNTALWRWGCDLRLSSFKSRAAFIQTHWHAVFIRGGKDIASWIFCSVSILLDVSYYRNVLGDLLRKGCGMFWGRVVIVDIFLVSAVNGNSC